MQLFNANCFDIFESIPKGTVSLILTDPPFGITNNPWDACYDDNIWYKEAYRVLKPNGCIIKFGQDKFSAKLMLNENSHHRFNMIWQKDRPSGHLDANRKPMRDHEDILVFSKEDIECEDMMVFYKSQPYYESQKEDSGKKSHSIGKAKTIKQTNYGEYERMNTDIETTMKHPRSVWYFPRPHVPLHPTQKPTELLEKLIKSYTAEGELVLDTFMGIGSTGIACKRTNREFIGIELEKKYFDIAKIVIDNSDKYQGSPTKNIYEKLIKEI